MLLASPRLPYRRLGIPALGAKRRIASDGPAHLLRYP